MSAKETKPLSWDELERDVEDLVAEGLEPYGDYEVVNSGQRNSTATDLTVNKDKRKHKKGEIKKLPSVAGVQTVVKLGKDGLYESSQKHSFTAGMVALANAEPLSLNRKLLLTGGSRDAAFQCLESKYSADEVDIIIGAHGTKFIACATTATEMQEHFDVSLIVRPKKSGSGRVSKRNHHLISDTLNSYHHTLAGGKIIINDLTKISELQTKLDLIKENFYVNKEGEIRQLSNTNNLTAMLSLSAKLGMSEDLFTPREDIAKLFI